MTYDCFIFYNELELLELRLHELSGVVDRFVLVEARETHSNKPKPLYFQENLPRFSAFRDKIIHIVVDHLPKSNDRFEGERFQRNAIVRGLAECQPEDLILVSDVDEIPRATVVQKMSHEIPFHNNPFSNAIHATLNSRLFKNVFHRKTFRGRLRKNHPFVWKFEQSPHLYFLNYQMVKPPVWYGTRMLRFRDFSCADEIRHSGYKIVKNAGWHFSFMGGVANIQSKIAAYSHQEYNQPQFTDAQVIQQRIERNEGLFRQDESCIYVPLDESFPQFIREHPEKFTGFIHSLS